MNRALIEGTLLVINEDKEGTSIVVPTNGDRPTFASVKARRDAVVLVDIEGDEHLLDGANPVDIETASLVGGIIVREMPLDGNAPDKEYPIAFDVDLSIDVDGSIGLGR